MAQIAINPDVTQSLITSFASQIDTLTTLTSTLDGEVKNQIGGQNPGWQGVQADSFAGTWNDEFKPSMDKLADSLNQAKDMLTKTLQAYQSLDGQG